MKLTECINFVLSNTKNAVFLYFKKELQQFDITPIQYSLLACLWQEDQQTPSQLAQELCLDTSTVTGLLARLESKELLVRTFCQEDRRRIIVCLTEAGRALQSPIEALIERANAQVTAGLSPQEVETLKGHLRQIAEQAEKLAT